MSGPLRGRVGNEGSRGPLGPPDGKDARAMDRELELLIERSKDVTVSDADLEEGRIAIAAANGALTDARITIDTMRAVRTVMLAAEADAR